MVSCLSKPAESSMRNSAEAAPNGNACVQCEQDVPVVQVAVKKCSGTIRVASRERLMHSKERQELPQLPQQVQKPAEPRATAHISEQKLLIFSPLTSLGREN